MQYANRPMHAYNIVNSILGYCTVYPCTGIAWWSTRVLLQYRYSNTKHGGVYSWRTGTRVVPWSTRVLEYGIPVPVACYNTHTILQYVFYTLDPSHNNKCFVHTNGVVD